MTLMGDNRKKKDGDEIDLEPDEKDDAALEVKGENPLAEEEAIQEDDEAGD